MKEEEWLPESWAKRALETRAGQGWRGLHLDRELGGKNILTENLDARVFTYPW